MKWLAFQQVDVLTAVPFKGNPVAVVLDGDAVSSEQMHRCLDEFVGDNVRLFADEPAGRLPPANLHTQEGSAVRRPSDDRIGTRDITSWP
jgi:hypothetical protein